MSGIVGPDTVSVKLPACSSLTGRSGWWMVGGGSWPHMPNNH